MSNNSNNDNNSEFAPFNDFDIARQNLQFVIGATLADFEAKWGVPIARIRINRETEDNYGNYTKLSTITPHNEAQTSFIASVTVEFSPAQLVSPNRVPVLTDKELEEVADQLAEEECPF